MGYGRNLKIIRNIVNTGIDKDTDFYQKRETRILNTLILTVLGIIIVVVLTVCTFFPEINTIEKFALPVLTSFYMSGILYLNYLKRYELAIYTFVIGVNASMFFACQVFDERSGNFLYFYLLVFCLAVFHNPRRRNIRTIVFFSMVFVTFFLARKLWFVNLRHTDLPGQDMKHMFNYNQFMVLLVMSLMCYSVVRLINKQSQETLELLEKGKKVQEELSQSLHEKEVLLAEVHHRVKNNLAVISGLLNLQMEKTSNTEALQFTRDLKNRVMSMSLIHTNLYRRHDLSRIDLKSYLNELSRDLVAGYAFKFPSVHLNTELEEVEMDVTRAVPIGIIITELITNSLKHAFNKLDCEPELLLTMLKKDERIHITIKDNGPGYTPGNVQTSSLGLLLIQSLAEQIDADVIYPSLQEGRQGTEVII